jgi:cellulose synthase/poly-beta-1,6-N-acetylglucosamine synthase-like glycosyltransferase
MAIAETCFFRAEVLEQVGGFGEELGIGCAAPWQSGAETDLLLRVMRAGWRVVYDPRVAAYEENPDDPEPGGRAFRAKARHAARGTGRVYRLNYGAGRCLQTVVRALGAAVMYACRRRWARAAWYLQQAIGRVEGITGLILPAPAPFGPQNHRSSAR